MYRMCIGLFGPGRGFKGSSNKNQYQAYIKGTDIHWRMFIIGLYLLVQTWACVTFSNALQNLVSSGPISGFPVNTCICQVEVQHASVHCIYTKETMLPEVSNSFWSSKILLCSGDIELNPGPVTDKEEILQAISASHDSISRELKSVKEDLFIMRNEIEGVKLACNEVKSKTESLDKNQALVNGQLQNIEHELDNLRGENHNLHLDIDALQQIVEDKNESLNECEDLVDKMEAQMIKNNVRVFGMVNLDPSSNIKQLLVDNVLKVACPDSDWSTNLIAEAFSVGKGNQNRIVIAKFNNFSDKMKLFRGRNELREKGIRIADDLTTRQRVKLAKLKNSGQIGYFYRGELCVRENTPNQDGREMARSFVNAKRRFSNVNKSQTDQPTSIEVD